MEMKDRDEARNFFAGILLGEGTGKRLTSFLSDRRFQLPQEKTGEGGSGGALSFERP